MHSHLDALQAMPPVNFRRGPREFRSVTKQASFYVAFGTDFPGFWKPKWIPKFHFRGFFFRRYFSLLLSIQFWWIFRASEPEKQQSYLEKTMIFAKLAFSIEVRTWLDFAFIFRGQNEENPYKNRIQKRIVLQHRV